MNEQYLNPILIEDPRLTPDLKRHRSGRTQAFYKPDNRSLQTEDADFTLEPPLPHIHSTLIKDKWHWINGCDECHGREGTWTTYIKCEKHDVCHLCKMPRSKLKEAPWGHPKGFECKPCHSKKHEEEKTKALAAMTGRYDEWDYRSLSELKCPYCDLEFEDSHEYYDVSDHEIECDRCDHVFKVTAEPRVTFTTTRTTQPSESETT